MLNNPLKYTDPTGHWREDELKTWLGEDWYKRLFGKNGAFFERDNLLAMLRSKDTHNIGVLTAITDLVHAAEGLHKLGVDFKGVDAIGARLAGSVGSNLMGAINADAILNLSAGEFSLFLSPEVGGILGGSMQAVMDMTLIYNLPTNDNYSGVGVSGGFVAGYGIGINGEAFWSSPMADTYDPYDKMHGYFFGVGVSSPQIGVYVTMSYALQVYKYDEEGTKGINWFVGIDLKNIYPEIKNAIRHDFFNHPMWE